jgi:hypothetical protein
MDRSKFELPDGRVLDLWVEGPTDGIPLVFHPGSPSPGLPWEPMVRMIADRGLQGAEAFAPIGHGVRGQVHDIGDTDPSLYGIQRGRAITYINERAEDLLGHGLEGDAGRRLNVALTIRRLGGAGSGA